MAKAINKEFELWVSESVKRLAGHFNFCGWRIEIVYKGEHKDSPEWGGNVYAETHVDSVYLTIHLTLYKQAREDFESGNLSQLSMALTHELVHVFLDPFHTFAIPHLSDITAPFFSGVVENQTQKLTMVFLKNMPAEIFPPRTKHGKHD